MANRKSPPKYDLSFVGIDFSSVWLDWLDYKYEINNCYKTQRGVENGYKHLLRLSNGVQSVAREIVDQSIENGWKGLFPLIKENNGHKLNNNISGQSLFSQADAILQGNF